MAYYDGEILKQILGKKLNEFEELNVPISEVAIKIGQAIKEAPAADVVEVPCRCKKCRYGKLMGDNKTYVCIKQTAYKKADDYCSSGKRK